MFKRSKRLRPRPPRKTRKLSYKQQQQRVTTRTEILVSALFTITIRTTRFETREGSVETILVENEDPSAMAKFFGRHRGRRHTDIADKDSGLSDKTNFPLLSSKWMRPSENSTNFSARGLLSNMAPSGDRRSLLTGSTSTSSPSEVVKPDPKAVSPTQEVASTWMQMGSKESKGAFPTVPSSARPRRTNTSQPSSRDTTRESSRRSSYMYATNSGARRNHSSSTSQRSSRHPSHNTSRPNSSMRKPNKHSLSSSATTSEWRSALDAKSGRTYYYNVRTRETQWRKPMELASPEERREMEEKERKQKDFFAAMEANILKQMAAGVVPGTPKVTDVEMKEAPVRTKKPMLEKPSMVRTISAMDAQILKELVKRQPSLRSSKMSRDNSMNIEDLGNLHDARQLSNISEESIDSMNMSAMEMSLSDLNYDMEVDSSDSPSAREENQALMQLAKTAEQMAMASGSVKVSPEEAPKPKGKMPLASGAVKRPSLDARRNTCGTMYVGSTMSAPDKDATIKVRCTILFGVMTYF